ncbi:MAG: hypothetical protein KDK33_09495, partial [Leptospiraceae bacterium]|nr:hypothetical protein [Leptospiraceae bacterium]
DYFLVWTNSVPRNKLAKLRACPFLRKLNGQKIAEVSGEITWPADGGLTKVSSQYGIRNARVINVIDIELCDCE